LKRYINPAPRGAVHWVIVATGLYGKEKTPYIGGKSGYLFNIQ
jgi:hypothetical protein